MNNLFTARAIGCILALIVFSSCSYSLAKKPLYRDYLHKPLTLKYDTELFEVSKGYWTFWGHGKALKPGELYVLAETPSTPPGEIIREKYYNKFMVKSGTALTINKIYSFYGDSWHEVRVLGTIYVEDLGKNIPFYYVWPMSPKYPQVLLRAAWEDESVPGERFIGLPENRINFENR